MSVVKTTRPSDSRLIQRVATRHYLGGEGDVTMPDGSRDIVVIKKPDGEVFTMLTGTITQPIALDFPPGSEVMNIMLTLGASFTESELAAPKMRNQSLILAKAGRNKVWLGSKAMEMPTFENAEGFVDKLVDSGLLHTDAMVEKLVTGSSVAASERTLQRRFMHATGLTYKYFTQLERAWKAASLLQMGLPALDVAFALGYTDQPHMIKSLKSLLGKTPTQFKTVHAPEAITPSLRSALERSVGSHSVPFDYDSSL